MAMRQDLNNIPTTITNKYNIGTDPAWNFVL